MRGNILGIDRGSRKLGLAYRQAASGIVFPIGGIENNSELTILLGDILTRYEIGTVVLGKPLTPFAQQHISVLQDTLIAIDSSIEIHMADEAYTSVQADVLLETSVDHPGQDTVAAMKFLEFFVDTKSQHSSSH